MGNAHLDTTQQELFLDWRVLPGPFQQIAALFQNSFSEMKAMGDLKPEHIHNLRDDFAEEYKKAIMKFEGEHSRILAQVRGLQAASILFIDNAEKQWG